MTTSETIAAGALIVSTLSLALAATALWRTYKASQPIAWLTITRTSVPNVWEMTLNIRNMSAFPWQADRIVLPIRSVPLAKKQDFYIRVGNDPELGVAFSLLGRENSVVQPGDTRAISLQLARAALSNNDSVAARISLISHAAKPTRKWISLRGTIPPESLTVFVL